MRFYLALIIVFIVGLNPDNLSAQTKFRVIADKKTVGLNEYVRIQFHLDNTTEVTSFVAPSFTDFVKVQGPEQITGELTINGAVNHYISFAYILKPVKKGLFTLPPARAVVDGKMYQSPPLSLIVNEHGSSNQPVETEEDGDISLEEFILKKNESPHQKIHQNVFVRLEVSKKSVFVGEPLVATYKLYTRLNSESRILRRPSLNGFSVVDMIEPEAHNVYRENYRGKDYNVYILRKAQLYPLQEGEFELEPMDVENTVSFVKEEYAEDERALWRKLKAFGEEGIRPDAWTRETVTMSSQPLVIAVKPLPSVKPPAIFNGAVGVFNVSAEMPAAEVHEGDVVNLQVTVSGSGNLPLLGSPEIRWPETVEIYDVRIREQLNNSSAPVSGKKIFTIPFSPKKSGHLDLPPVSLTSFNPVTKTYSTSTSRPLSIEVLPAAAKPSGKVAAMKRIIEQNKSMSATWIAAGIFVLLALVFISYRLYTRKKSPLKPFPEKIPAPVTTPEPVVTTRQPLTPAPAKKYLENAQPALFYRQLDKIIRQLLSEQFGVSRLEAPGQVKQSLLRKQVDPADAEDIRVILEDCEISSYSPLVLEEKMMDDFDRSADLMRKLQETLPANQ